MNRKPNSFFRPAALLALLAVFFLATAAGATEEFSTNAADLTVTGALNDIIGAAIAVGDFNGDQAADLFIGAPGG